MEEKNCPCILIADDETHVALLIQSLIEKHFAGMFKVEAVQNVKDALHYIEHNSVDVLFLDIELKGESGFALLDKISHRDFQFVCLSASKEHAFKAFEYGSSGYLLKPVNGGELAVVLERVFSIPPHSLRLRSD